MTQDELLNWLDSNEHIEWADNEEDEQLLFRNTRLEWYRNDDARHTAVDYYKIGELTPDELLTEINRGLLVEGITRITGYFTKTSSWNPGKLAELKDRRRGGIE